ncbi:hypothetical protein ACI2IY_05810 [Lysobacter enzymogenes]|uniref:hypothetical protein n=1 Tax=Lysobacter enzymogenes TaxID=69 RepID=UPI003850B623
MSAAQVDRLLYLIAHAPAEPQDWFVVAPSPQPVMPLRPTTWTEFQRDQYAEYDEGEYEFDELDPVVAEYVLARKAAQAAREAWALDCKRQRAIQWPRAWAEAVLSTLAQGTSGDVQTLDLVGWCNHLESFIGPGAMSGLRDSFAAGRSPGGAAP